MIGIYLLQTGSRNRTCQKLDSKSLIEPRKNFTPFFSSLAILVPPNWVLSCSEALSTVLSTEELNKCLFLSFMPPLVKIQFSPCQDHLTIRTFLGHSDTFNVREGEIWN